MKHRILVLAFMVTCFTAICAQARYLQMQQQYGYIQNRPPAISPSATIQHVSVRPIVTTVVSRQTVQPTVQIATSSQSLKPVARFKSQPPQLKQYHDGMNLYQYCKSDPVNYVDPWGLTAISEYRNPGTMGHTGLIVDGKDYDYGPKGSLSLGSGPGQSPWMGSKNNMTAEATKYTLELKKSGKMKYGPNKGKKCCSLTLRNVAICVKYAAVRWDGTTYKVLTNNCRSFVKDAKSKCCLKRK